MKRHCSCRRGRSDADDGRSGEQRAALRFAIACSLLTLAARRRRVELPGVSPPAVSPVAFSAGRPAGTPLGELLVGAGAVAPSALSAALDEQRREGGRLGALLQARGAVGPATLRVGLAAHFDMDTLEVGDVPLPLLPASQARRLRAVAVESTAPDRGYGAQPVAFSDPVPGRVAAVARHLDRPVRPLVVDDSTLDELLQAAYVPEDALAVAEALPRRAWADRVPAVAGALAAAIRRRPGSGPEGPGSKSEAPPLVTVLVPLQRDNPATLRSLWAALEQLEYPIACLHGLVLVAAGDEVSRSALAKVSPPAWLRAASVPVAGASVRTALVRHGARNARGALTAVVNPHTPPAPDDLRRAVSGRTTVPTAVRSDIDQLLGAWARPRHATTCFDTAGLARALGWQPEPAARGRHLSLVRGGRAADGPAVWVCVPTFNEAANVEALCLAALSTLREAGIDGHVLVIDDASPDGTGELAEALAATDPRMHVLHRPRKEGIGPAYLAGFRHCLAHGADLVVEMDCDFSHDPSALPQLVEAAADADLVLGSRYVPGGTVADWPLKRRLLSRGGSLYARRILALDVRDLTGGFKCFRREVLESLVGQDVRAAGYGFQIEMTYRALLAGHTAREIPITFRDRTEGTSKMSAGIALEAALTVVRLRGLERQPRANVLSLPVPAADSPRREPQEGRLAAVGGAA